MSNVVGEIMEIVRDVSVTYEEEGPGGCALIDRRHVAIVEALRVLAEHVQRHDELVAAEWRYNRNVDMRAYPDGEMDELCTKMRYLRAEIAGLSEEAAEQEGEEVYVLTEKGRALADSPRARDVAGPEDFDEYLSGADNVYAGPMVPKEELDVAKERIERLERELAERDRTINWQEGCISDKTDRANELRRRVERLEKLVAALQTENQELELKDYYGVT